MIVKETRKVCSNCQYCCEGIISDGKGTHVFSCIKIRGGKNDGFEFEYDHMKVAKNRPACQFFRYEYSI